jgi:hypothetical protein
MPILGVPLGQHVEIEEGSLPQEIIRLSDEVHEELKGGRVLDLVIIINHQLRIQAWHWPTQDPLQAAGIQIAQLLSGQLVVKLLQKLQVTEILRLLLLEMESELWLLVVSLLLEIVLTKELALVSWCSLVFWDLFVALQLLELRVVRRVVAT